MGRLPPRDDCATHGTITIVPYGMKTKPARVGADGDPPVIFMAIRPRFLRQYIRNFLW
jgi:hypothetical protein